ncbi:hypothetical protein [Mesorhizobium sp.]|uniref:hypothetical protein n=1 Tax=Mesorhizobium sp. TaxID=1871066 RepID=UPI00257A38D4|nr:hypothetical protein [Mesorhizobium sp.]
MSIFLAAQRQNALAASPFLVSRAWAILSCVADAAEIRKCLSHASITSQFQFHKENTGVFKSAA